MALLDQETESSQSQLPLLFLDNLYCKEEHFEEDLGLDYCYTDESVKKSELFPLSLLEQDLVHCQDDELESLLIKEKESCVCEGKVISSDGFVRKEAVDWLRRVSAYYGFTALTSVLAVNYFDRFSLSVGIQGDKPWMSQLVAVACLSLAAKVEEIQVPLLSDLQVEDCKYVFEPKTIKRMELLVLSTLQWKMNPVTPISYFDHIIRRLGLKSNIHWEFLWRCERLILSVISDSRFVDYLPSVLATATMLYVIQEVESYDSIGYRNQLLSVLKLSKDNVDSCYELILDLSGSPGHIQNRKHKRKMSIPSSPNGVIDVSFSCDNSSNDSWAVASPVSSKQEPLFKRSRSQDQQMRLPSLTRVSMNMLSSPK